MSAVQHARLFSLPNSNNNDPFHVRNICTSSRRWFGEGLSKEGREAGIEVEFESRNFEREHMNEADKCDIIVCWKDTWGRATIKPVIELASLLY